MPRLSYNIIVMLAYFSAQSLLLGPMCVGENSLSVCCAHDVLLCYRYYAIYLSLLM